MYTYIRKKKMQHLIELAKDGGVVDSVITDGEVEYLRGKGFKVEKDKYSILDLYRIEKEDEKEVEDEREMTPEELVVEIKELLKKNGMGQEEWDKIKEVVLNTIKRRKK